jgi:hypothetical protein
MRWLLLALALAACGDNDKVTPDGSPPMPDAPPDATPPTPTLTTFVIDLVANQTSDTTEPLPFDQFSMLPDPDGTNNNVHAYDPLF